MATIKRIFHSEYKGRNIFHRKGIKRRPWVVEFYDNDDGIRYADLPTLDSCYAFIERDITRKTFVCYLCGYTCNISQLGGEWDCPGCGDN